MNNHLTITAQDKKRFVEKTNAFIELNTAGLLMADIINEVISEYDGKKMNARVINAINDRFKNTIDPSLGTFAMYDKTNYITYNYICAYARKNGLGITIQLPIPKHNQVISKDKISTALNKYKESFNGSIESNQHAIDNMDLLFKMLYDLETSIQNYADMSNSVFRDMFKPLNSSLVH